MKRDYPSGPIIWRHQNDAAADKAMRELTDIRCEDPSLTQQHFAIEANLNTIAKRFGLDKGPIPAGSFDPALGIDHTNMPDLRQILDYNRDAKNKFAELPQKLRKRFHNDPRELWSFITDPDNAEEALRLGLLVKSPDSAGSANSSPASPAPSPTGGNTSGANATPEEPPAAPPKTPPQTSHKGTS